jgi:hypothetical protein
VIARRLQLLGLTNGGHGGKKPVSRLVADCGKSNFAHSDIDEKDMVGRILRVRLGICLSELSSLEIICNFKI